MRICLSLSLLLTACGAGAQSPSLSISILSPGIVQLSWRSNFTDWRLTSTTNLATAGSWDSVLGTPVVKVDKFAVQYLIGEQARWFRLEQGALSCVFHATPSVIQPGGSSTLSWCSVAGTSYQLLPGPGTVTGSNYVVSPSTTTIYSLTASNVDGVTTNFATVTVTSGGVCDFATVTSWDCRLNFSYELTPSSADYSFVIRHEGHLTIHLTPYVINPPNLVQFQGYASGNIQLNDRMEDFSVAPPDVYTVVGSGAPAPGSSVLALNIDCIHRTYSFAIGPAVESVYTSPTGSQSVVMGAYMSLNQKPLPSTVGAVSGAQFVSVRGPAWSGGGDYYHCVDSLGDQMFTTGLVNDDTAGSASVNWSFTPNP